MRDHLPDTWPFYVTAVLVIIVIISLLGLALQADSKWREECEAAGGTIVSETEYTWLPFFNPTTKLTELRYMPQTTSECIK